jgi:AcrR family transcriptional regulator
MTARETAAKASAVATAPQEPERRRYGVTSITRLRLLETAERLFAERGIEAVTLREIQVGAGQGNASVIAYHFGSKTGLVRAISEHRRVTIEADREELLRLMKENGATADPVALVWLIVKPLVNSVRSNRYFVPFLARLTEEADLDQYWPEQLDTPFSTAAIQDLIHKAFAPRPLSVNRRRYFQMFNSVVHLLADHARRYGDVTDDQLTTYVEGWVAMLTAPAAPVGSGVLPIRQAADTD